MSMKRLGIGSILILLFALTALAQTSIDAEGVATGKTVLWFYGTEVTALIESDFDVEGTIEIDGEAVSFTASGTAYGEGVGDTATLSLNVWLLMEAVGTTADGEPITIRGGMAGSSADADISGGALGSATGPFFLVVTLGDDTCRAQGTAEGSATGTFVVPDDPLTMQMEGIGTYTLAGELVPDDGLRDEEAAESPYLEHLPWDSESWPAELFARLLALLHGVPYEPSEEPEGEPADV
jgi:hypothetical protein